MYLGIFSQLFFECEYFLPPGMVIYEISTSCLQHPDEGNGVSDFFYIGSRFYFMIKNGKLFVIFFLTFFSIS